MEVRFTLDNDRIADISRRQLCAISDQSAVQQIVRSWVNQMQVLVCRFKGEHIVSCQRSPDALEREFSDRFNTRGVFERYQDTGTNQDLTRLCFVAKTGSDVGNCPDGCVVEPPLESNGAERGITVRSKCTEARCV
jgi:hypothetical protein